MLGPRSPWSSPRQKFTYCVQSGWSSPNDSVKYPWSSCEAVESACRREIRPAIGSPGIRRGIAQSIVTATKKVRR